jgi:hypothetical protein
MVMVKTRMKISIVTERCYGFTFVGPFVNQTELDDDRLNLMLLSRNFVPMEHHDPLGSRVAHAVFLGESIPQAVAHAVRRFRNMVGGTAPCHEEFTGALPGQEFCLYCMPEIMVALFFLILTDVELKHTVHSHGAIVALQRTGLSSYVICYHNAATYFPAIAVWEFEIVKAFEPTRDVEAEWDSVHMNTSDSDPDATNLEDDDDDV